MVLADSHGISRAPWYSGYSLFALLFVYKTFTFYGRSFQIGSTKLHSRDESPTTPQCMHYGLGFSLFARHYYGNRVFFLFLQVLRCFSSLGCLRYSYVFRVGLLDITPAGLPHSDIPGSKPACGSPRLFAAYHVLLRLLAPRHPPYALSSLTY